MSDSEPEIRPSSHFEPPRCPRLDRLTDEALEAFAESRADRLADESHPTYEPWHYPPDWVDQ